MFDVIAALHSVLDKSAKQAITQWLGKLPKEASWHVISDYVFDDPNLAKAIAENSRRFNRCPLRPQYILRSRYRRRRDEPCASANHEYSSPRATD